MLSDKALVNKVQNRMKDCSVEMYRHDGGMKVSFVAFWPNGKRHAVNVIVRYGWQNGLVDAVVNKLLLQRDSN